MQPTQSSDTAATADDVAAPAAGAGVLEKAMGLLYIVSAAGQPMTFTDLVHA